MKAKIIILMLVLAIFPPVEAQTAKPNAEKSFSIDETLKELGVILSWDPFFASGVLNKGENRLKFYAGIPGERGPALFNGRDVLTVPLPYIEEGTLRFPEAFVAAAKSSFSPVAPNPAPKNNEHFRIAAIVIDPGHGGKDPGATGDHTTHTMAGKKHTLVEKDIVLKVSKKLASLLSAAYPGKKILLTRNNDTYPTHPERVKVANAVPLKDNEAIIFISIHANAVVAKGSSARGYEIWYLPPETQRELIDREKFTGNNEVIPILNDMLQAEFISESIRLGQFILSHFKEVFGNRIPSRGMKAENWYVVKNARMPAILVELGFLSNIEDAKLMVDEKHLNLFSEALYKGITDFVTEFEQSGGYIAP